MRIITLTCSTCGTIVAANELESNRVMKCPRVNCENVLKFADVPKDDREHVLENKERYEV